MQIPSILCRMRCPVYYSFLYLLELWAPSTQLLGVYRSLPLFISVTPQSPLVLWFTNSLKVVSWDNCRLCHFWFMSFWITVLHCLICQTPWKLLFHVFCLVFGCFRQKGKYDSCNLLLAISRSIIWFHVLLIISSGFQQLQLPPRNWVMWMCMTPLWHPLTILVSRV